QHADPFRRATEQRHAHIAAQPQAAITRQPHLAVVRLAVLRTVDGPVRPAALADVAKAVDDFQPDDFAFTQFRILVLAITPGLPGLRIAFGIERLLQPGDAAVIAIIALEYLHMRLGALRGPDAENVIRLLCLRRRQQQEGEQPCEPSHSSATMTSRVPVAFTARRVMIPGSWSSFASGCHLSPWLANSSLPRAISRRPSESMVKSRLPSSTGISGVSLRSAKSKRLIQRLPSAPGSMNARLPGSPGQGCRLRPTSREMIMTSPLARCAMCSSAVSLPGMIMNKATRFASSHAW